MTRRPCLHPGCPALVEGPEARCPAHSREAQAAADRRRPRGPRPKDPRPSAAARGYDYRWQQLRVRVLARSPLCADCAARGRTAWAREVHHLEPVSKAPERRLDPANLVALCRDCHQARERAALRPPQAAAGPTATAGHEWGYRG